MDWITLKAHAVTVIGLDRDALHVYAAVALQIFIAFVTRRSIASIVPWLAVFGLEAANELADLFFEIWPDRALQRAAGLHDLVNTMLMPSALLLAARFAPSLFTAPPRLH